jgi:hypothetical protein
VLDHSRSNLALSASIHAFAVRLVLFRRCNEYSAPPLRFHSYCESESRRCSCKMMSGRSQAPRSSSAVSLQSRRNNSAGSNIAVKKRTLQTDTKSGNSQVAYRPHSLSLFDVVR